MLKLPRLSSLRSVIDQNGRPSAEFGRRIDQAFTAIENAIRTVLDAAGGIVVATDSSGDVVTRSIAAGTGISVTNGSGVDGNPIIAMSDTGVTSGGYGNSTHTARIGVDAQGRLTSAEEDEIEFCAQVISDPDGRTITDELSGTIFTN